MFQGTEDSHGWEQPGLLLSPPPGGGGILDGTFFASLLLPPNLFATNIPQVPTPVCTSDFPDVTPMSKHGRVCRGRRRRGCMTACGNTKRQRSATQDCCICLETLPPDNTVTAVLPCQHAMHRQCLFSLVTYPVLGARSMVHCPLCRRALDRYDMEGMGMDVSIPRLVQAAKRCNNLRRLMQGPLTAGSHPQPLSPADCCQTDSRLDLGGGTVGARMHKHHSRRWVRVQCGRPGPGPRHITPPKLCKNVASPVAVATQPTARHNGIHQGQPSRSVVNQQPTEQGVSH